MQIYILDKNYQTLGMIDEYESVLWRKKFNDVGEAEIYLPCSVNYLALLEKGNYLYRYDDDMFCKIQKVEIETDVENGDYIIATATDIATILSGRIIRWKITYSGTVAGFIQKVLTDNAIYPTVKVTELVDGKLVTTTALHGVRQIKNLEIDTSNFSEFTEMIDITVVNEDLLQRIISVCKAYNYGFRISYDKDSGKLIFRLYKGKYKASTAGDEYVEFSPTYANIISSAYETDDSNFKNVAYVGYKSANKDDENIYLLSLFNEDTEPTGEERKELYIDATGTSREIDIETLQAIFNNSVMRFPAVMDYEIEGYYYAIIDGVQQTVATFEITETDGVKQEKITVTDYTYFLLLQAVGKSKLAEHLKTQKFAGVVDTINTYDYKLDYDLGDFVSVINDYGIEAAAQIIEVLESDDNENGYEVEPTFDYFN